MRKRRSVCPWQRPRRNEVLLENRHPPFLPVNRPWHLEADCPPENQGFPVALASWRNHWFGERGCSNRQLSFTILCQPLPCIFRPLVERGKGREVLFQIRRWYCHPIGQQGMVAQSSCRYAKILAWQLEVESQEELASVPGWFARNWFSWVCVFPYAYAVAQDHQTTPLPPGGKDEETKGHADQSTIQAGNRILVGLVQVLWFRQFNIHNSKRFALWN